uniref:Uncharacterized protein n=2 Tax=Avena sativa TaxID=4498 RepID=A0ACD5WBF0_AVESA
MAAAPRTSAACRYQQFSALLSSAVLEWVLMLLMLLEGLLSCLATSFARLCKLQPPCPMCARLDHVLGDAGARYRDLMCSSHKAEASSWAFCRVHQNLADVHGMCEACLLSFAADDKSNLETYRSLTGKLGGVGIGNEGFRGAAQGKVMEDGALCSCCSVGTVKARSSHFGSLQRNDGDTGVGGICRDVSGDRCDDAVDRVGYSELKTSDSEPELITQCVGDFRRSSEHADIIDNLKQDFALIHRQIKTAYGNAEEKVASYSEPTRVQDRVSDQILSEDSKQWPNIQPNDLPLTDGQEEITEETHADKRPEDDVWHNALGSSEESPGTSTTDVDDRSSETKAASDESKPEFSDRATARQDSLVVHQDLKLLLSQLSISSRTPEVSVEQQHEQAVLRNITRVLSLQRNYSGVSDGSMLDAEAEAECSTVDGLRRQVELDRRSMALLWKELEEERSASAVATSQAMAMITRLQEEKAATRTEAAQYRRVMEEQSAYDREDAERLAATVRDLEAEVERCRAEIRDQAIAGEIRDQMRLFPPRRREECSGGGLGDEENAYIWKQLRKLTDKLHRFSNNSSRVIQEQEPTDGEQEDGGGSGQEEDRAEASEVGRRVRNADNFTKWQQLQSMEVTKGRGGDNGSVVGGESADNMAGLEEEISELSGRLQALEADRSFLEHSVNSLRNGREGEAVIHDIARSLRELRKTMGNDVFDR